MATKDGSTDEGRAHRDLDLHELEERGEARWNPLRWFLLTGNRRLVTLVLVVVVFVAFLTIGRFWTFEFQDLLTETGPLQTLFNTLLSGIILLVSVVVSINSVVISQELGSLGTHFERLEESLSFRESIEDIAGEEVSPSEADQFLGFVLETLHERALLLRDVIDDHPDRDLRDRVDRLVDVADEDLHAVADDLSRLNLERPNVLLAGLEFDYASHLYAVRFLRSYHEGSFNEEQDRAFDEFVEALHFFAASREYFKTLFYKREMAALSSTLLYVSLPVIVFLGYVLLALREGLFPEWTMLGLPAHSLYVSIGFTVALAPYLVLTAYVIRAAFVARRSLEVGPFMAHPDVSKPDIEWEE